MVTVDKVFVEQPALHAHRLPRAVFDSHVSSRMGRAERVHIGVTSSGFQHLNGTHVRGNCTLISQIVLNENALLKELSVEYVPQIGFLTALHERFGDLVPEDFSFAFSQVYFVRASDRYFEWLGLGRGLVAGVSCQATACFVAIISKPTQSSGARATVFRAGRHGVLQESHHAGSGRWHRRYPGANHRQAGAKSLQNKSSCLPETVFKYHQFVLPERPGKAGCVAHKSKERLLFRRNAYNYVRWRSEVGTTGSLTHTLRLGWVNGQGRFRRDAKPIVSARVITVA